MPTFRATVRIDHTLSGAPAYNVWHLRASNLYGSQNEIANALTALTQFYTAVKGFYPTSATIRVPHDLVKHGDDYAPGVPGTDENEGFTSTSIVGTGGTTLGPSPLAIVVGWETTIRSRSGRGRTFLGPFNYLQHDNVLSQPAASTCASIRTAAAALIAAGEGPDGWAWGVFSRKQNIIRDFTDYTVHPRWAVLRSRRD